MTTINNNSITITVDNTNPKGPSSWYSGAQSLRFEMILTYKGVNVYKCINQTYQLGCYGVRINHEWRHNTSMASLLKLVDEGLRMSPKLFCTYLGQSIWIDKGQYIDDATKTRHSTLEDAMAYTAEWVEETTIASTSNVRLTSVAVYDDEEMVEVASALKGLSEQLHNKIKRAESVGCTCCDRQLSQVGCECGAAVDYRY